MSVRVIALALAVLLLLGVSSIEPVTAQTTSLPVESTEFAVEAISVSDAASAVQPSTTASEQQAQEEESLPPALAAIFAALGLYIVTMFTLSIGTEIAVDVFKLAVGLKSKPSARDTMQKFNDLIPGSLSGLGASVEAEQQLQRHITNLTRLLEPVVEVEDILANLQDGHIGAAIQNILKLADTGPLPTTEEAVQVVRQELHQAIDKLAGDLGLGSFFTVPVLDKLDGVLNSAASTDPKEVLRSCILILQGDTAQMVTTWARSQLDTLAAGSRSTVERKYYDTLRPQIKAFNIGEANLKAIDEWFKSFLERFESQSSQQVDIYLESLNQLLKGVERQRYMIRSPISKVWDAMSTWPLIGPVVKGIQRAFRRFLRQGESDQQLRITPHISDITNAARTVMELEQRHKDAAESRVRWLRTLSVIVGILLAYMLRIDSADLLVGLLPDGTTNFLGTALIPANEYSLLFMRINIPHGITAGIILSGLAASAGSSFWHDQLGRLQAVKQVSEAAYSTIRTVQSAVADEDKKS
jgi:hypothetical protein